MTGVPRGGFVQEAGAVLDERSSAACALVSCEGRLHLAWTGTDSRLNLVSSIDGLEFAGKETLRHRSSRSEALSTGSSVTTRTIPLAPALAATGHDGMYLAWTGTDSRVNVWRMRLGDEGHVILPERSSDGPVLGGRGDEVVIGWTGTDRRLNVARTRAGRFGEPWHLPDTSSHRPAVGSHGDELVIAWTGTDRRVNLLRALNGASVDRHVLDHRSDAAPAVCALGDELVLAWTGGDRRLNLLVLRAGVTVAHTIAGATSAHGPALGVHNGRLMLAWTGTDLHPNVVRLVRIR